MLSLAVLYTTEGNAENYVEDKATHPSFTIPRTEIVEIKDTGTGRIYSLFIKTPKSYRKSPNKNYPVIYLTDANYAFQIVSGATRYPMNAGKMEEAFIVGISYEKDSLGDSSRVRDYTPVKSSQWRKVTGQAEQHMHFIANDVFSYMQKNYRVDRNNSTFIGNSLGGLFASYILINKPDMFKNYIIGSPSYWFDDQAFFSLEESARKQLPDIKANVFIGIGERETKALESNYFMVEDAQVMQRKMKAWQQPHLRTKLIVIPEANHQTAFPTTAIQGLHWVLGK